MTQDLDSSPILLARMPTPGTLLTLAPVPRACLKSTISQPLHAFHTCHSPNPWPCSSCSSSAVASPRASGRHARHCNSPKPRHARAEHLGRLIRQMYQYTARSRGIRGGRDNVELVVGPGLSTSDKPSRCFHVVARRARLSMQSSWNGVKCILSNSEITDPISVLR
jgi:hypothetical protein